MIARTSSPHPPAPRPLGSYRWINGERCMLYGYTTVTTPGGTPLPKYRRPDGSTFVLRPRKKEPRVRAPEVYARVKVKIPAASLEGVVIKRSPLLIRITDKRSPYYGQVMEKPRYVLSKGKNKES